MGKKKSKDIKANGKNTKDSKSGKNTNIKNIAPTSSKVDPKALNVHYKTIIEEKIKMFLGVILVILFLILFGTVAWYFVTQVDATLVNGTASVQSIFSLL